VYAVRARLPVRIATLIVPVEHLSTAPPAVHVLKDAAGQMIGLQFAETGEAVRFDDSTLTAGLS
jgi:hypothetical protein